MATKKWNWYSPKDKKPRLDKNDSFNKEHGYSIRVLVYENNSVRFARFNHKFKSWMVEGRMGRIKVISWCYIKLPKKLESVSSNTNGDQ